MLMLRLGVDRAAARDLRRGRRDNQGAYRRDDAATLGEEAQDLIPVRPDGKGGHMMLGGEAEGIEHRGGGVVVVTHGFGFGFGGRGWVG